MVDKLDRATDERAPRPRLNSKHGRFMLIKLNSPVSPWHFYVIRAQRDSAAKSVSNILEKYTKATVLLKIEYQPNAVNLFNLIKEELRTQRKVILVCGNYVKLTPHYCEEQFVTDIERINELKKEV